MKPTVFNMRTALPTVAAYGERQHVRARRVFIV